MAAHLLKSPIYGHLVTIYGDFFTIYGDLVTIFGDLVTIYGDLVTILMVTRSPLSSKKRTAHKEPCNFLFSEKSQLVTLSPSGDEK